MLLLLEEVGRTLKTCWSCFVCFVCFCLSKGPAPAAATALSHAASLRHVAFASRGNEVGRSVAFASRAGGEVSCFCLFMFNLQFQRRDGAEHLLAHKLWSAIMCLKLKPSRRYFRPPRSRLSLLSLRGGPGITFPKK